jgi:ParB/RepB/Spo0J family partition protein
MKGGWRKMESEFIEVPINKVKSIENVRTEINDSEIAELMQSIKQHGLLEPIGVWLGNDEYIISYGHRRLNACKKLGWKTITAKVLGEMNEEDMLILNATENLHRKDVNVHEIGRIFFLLREKGLSESEIAVRMSVPISRVKRTLAVFKYVPEEHRKDIVFLENRTGDKAGKIPLTSFNRLFTIRRELQLNPKEFNELLKLSKSKDLSLAQLKTITFFIKRKKCSLNEAIENVSKFDFKGMSFLVNPKVSQEMIEKNKSNSLTELLNNILKGKIEGNKDLIM